MKEQLQLLIHLCMQKLLEEIEKVVLAGIVVLSKNNSSLHMHPVVVSYRKYAGIKRHYNC